MERTKCVVASGSNPKHFIYITKSNRVDWDVGDTPDYCANPLAKLNKLKQLSTVLLPKMFRESAAISIGSAASSVINSLPTDNVSEFIQEAESDLKSRAKEFSYFIYASSASLMALFVYFLCFYVGAYANIYVIGMLGGVVGALISALHRADLNKFSLFESYVSIFAQSFFRVFIGMVSGIVIVAANQADIAFGFINNSKEAIFIFGVAAGFSERWIPDFLESLSKKQE